MIKNNRIFRLVPVLLIFSLLVAALTPSLVFAEGEVPEAVPSNPETTTSEQPVTLSVSDAIQSLADAQAVLVEQSGDSIPMASQTAIKLLGDPDPWFYCSGPGCVGGKSPFYASINLALADWAVRKGVGMIYLEGNYNVAQNVTISGLTVGLSTLRGIVRDTTTAGNKPILTGIMNIQDFSTGFTLQGLQVSANSISNAIYFTNNTGTIKLTDINVTNLGGPGIYIINKGAIILNQVSASDNLNAGAYLNNCNMELGVCKSTGGITVTNSAFMRNGNSGVSNSVGISVQSGGTILLNGVTAFENNGGGLDLGAFGYTATIKNSDFSRNVADPNSSVYGYGIWTIDNTKANITLDTVYLDENEADGAFLSTLGNITLKKVIATNNGRNGVLISEAYNLQNVGAKYVTITDSNFTDNLRNNLEVHASGAVKIINLRANNSTLGLGLFVNNTYAPTPLPVTLLGAVLNDNSVLQGARIQSKGTITLAGITAIGNGSNGIWLDNDVTGATGIVVVSALLGLNRFNDNGSDGLYITTTRSVSLSSVQANDNSGLGVRFYSNGPLGNANLFNVEAFNNSSTGIHMQVLGTVIVNKVVSSSNVGYGISVNNISAVSARLVRISNSSFMDNSSHGVTVQSVGAITLSYVTASGNGSHGALLANSIISLPTQLPQPVTVLKSTFDNNTNNGLTIVTQRQITLSSVLASGNTQDGVSADNTSSVVNSPIVVSGINRFESNTANGLYLNSHGLLNVTGVTALQNDNAGILAVTSSKGAAIKNSLLVGNGYWGLQLVTNGTTILSAVTAIQNGFGGFDDEGVKVTLSSGRLYVYSSVFIANSGWGLNIFGLALPSDAIISSNTIAFGNDAGPTYNDGNINID